MTAPFCSDDAVADANALADGDLGVDDAVLADLRKASDRHVRVHDGACADPRALGRPTRTRPMLASGATVAPALDVREPMHARRRTPLVGEQRDRACECQVRIVGAKHRAGSVGRPPARQ